MSMWLSDEMITWLYYYIYVLGCEEYEAGVPGNTGLLRGEAAPQHSLDTLHGVPLHLSQFLCSTCMWYRTTVRVRYHTRFEIFEPFELTLVPYLYFTRIVKPCGKISMDGLGLSSFINQSMKMPTKHCSLRLIHKSPTYYSAKLKILIGGNVF